VSEFFRVSLIGNPNTGKSSLFNALTGMKQKVGNFPGITVEKSTGYFRTSDGLTAELTDLPGTYSLFPKSADEAIPYKLLLDKKHRHHPELVVFIADATNLKRNLVLLTQVIDLRIPVIMALNMMDQAEAQGIRIDTRCLEQSLGIPVVPISARKKMGIDKLVGQIKREVPVSSKTFLENKVIPAVMKSPVLAGENGEGDSGIKYSDLLVANSVPVSFDHGVFQREDMLSRYKQIAVILNSCISKPENDSFKKRQEKIDKILTHKFWGYVIFLGILFVVFQAIFNWADYPMQLIDSGFAALANLVGKVLPDGILNDLITKGILAGLSGVIVFIPQIAFLFFFITLMEDTGYLARVAFLMDRTMRRFGLNGKSVIPLISGTACAVPAIMATRNIENPKSKLITILVTPLMSCSARLPVYVLLVGLAVPHKTVFGIFGMQGLVLLGLYILGFLGVIGGAALYHAVLKNKVKQYFILEMPVYRMPNWNNVGLTVYKKVSSFVREAGKIIVAISIVLWFLASYGPAEKTVFSKPVSERAVHPREEDGAARLENSYAGHIGHAIQPVVAPLGYDWKISISLITSFAAREVFVGTMSTLYGLQDDATDFNQLKKNMQEARDPDTGKPIYSLATVISLLIFYCFAMQCMSTMAVTYKETASAKWTLVQFAFMTGLAYIASLIVYQIMK
jgi:ferrous iron transport protein B